MAGSLPNLTTVQLIRVSGHEGVVGKETADQLAKFGSKCQLIGPEPACGISVGVAEKTIRDRTVTVKTPAVLT
jgi:ribonuclease HI